MPADDPNEVAARLEWLRHYLGKSQVEFAMSVGASPATVNNWTAGYGLSLKGARRIREVYGTPLDFLFYGDTASTLPHKMRVAWKNRHGG